MKLLLLVLLLSFSVCETHAQVVAGPASELGSSKSKLTPAALAPFEKILEPALADYNLGNATALFANFASTAQPPANARTFNALFEGVYKAEFGAIRSKKLIERETEPDPTHGVLVYEAVCDQRKVRLSVNFLREAGSLKIAQIRMEKL